MQAQTLNCPNCGAAISSDSPQCQYCESKLATVACPSCFAMMLMGSRHCPHCGAAAMRERKRLGGTWLEVAAFEKICANREQQSAVLGAGAGASVNGAR